MFPFFPLKRCFDYQNEQHWCCLLDNIQCTLLQFGENVNGDHFNLTLDFFWMGFVATYPSFPGRECYTSQQTYVKVNDTYFEGGTHEETLRPQSKARVMNKRRGDY